MRPTAQRRVTVRHIAGSPETGTAGCLCGPRLAAGRVARTSLKAGRARSDGWRGRVGGPLQRFHRRPKRPTGIVVLTRGQAKRNWRIQVGDAEVNTHRLERTVRIRRSGRTAVDRYASDISAPATISCSSKVNPASSARLAGQVSTTLRRRLSWPDVSPAGRWTLRSTCRGVDSES